MPANFALFDMVLLAFTFVFVLIAFFRGFVKELFALFSWVAALVISYYATPFVSHYLSMYSKNKMVLDIVTRTILFIVVFFIVSLSTSNLCKNLQDKIPSSFDKSLGVLYGLLKTLIIFSIIYSLTANLYLFLLGKQGVDTEKLPEVPTWMSEAKSSNVLKSTAVMIDPAVRSFIIAVTKNMDDSMFAPKTLDDKVNQVLDEDAAKAVAPKEVRPDDLPEGIDEDLGYNKKDIEKMTRLLEIIGK
jgi:membrane protein required for colicin V production